MADIQGRQGGALGLVLVVLLALELLAHGGLLLARQERAASAAGLKVLQTRMVAEGGIAGLLRQALPDSLGAVAVLHRTSTGSFAVGPHHVRVGLRRLDREVWLLDGEGRMDGEGWTWRTARLAWVADPAARAAAATSAVRSRRRQPPSPPGTVLAPRYTAAGAPAWCAPWAAAIDSLRVPGTALPPARLRAPTDWPNLGRLGPEALLALLPQGPTGPGTPAPATARGLCMEDPWNWGDPSEPGGVCAERFAVQVFPGDLELNGGVGQGVVVVMGDLRMRATAFEGLLVVGGSASLSGGARLFGRLDVGGRLMLSPESRVTASPCHVARGVHQASSWLARPQPLPEVGRMEVW